MPGSGKKAVIYKAYGYDLTDAGRLVDVEREGNLPFVYAIISLTVEFDGERLAYEDIYSLEAEDLDPLLRIVGK